MTERDRLIRETRGAGNRSEYELTQRIREQLTQAFLNEIKMREAQRVAKHGAA